MADKGQPDSLDENENVMEQGGEEAMGPDNQAGGSDGRDNQAGGNDGRDNQAGGNDGRDNRVTDNPVGRDQPVVAAPSSTSEIVATPVASEPVPDQGHYKPIVMTKLLSVNMGSRCEVPGMNQARELAHQSEPGTMAPPWVTPKGRK